MQTLIFLNGKIPGRRLINKITEKKNYIIAADGGANALKKIGIIPDIIIGDFDSVSKATLNYFASKKVVCKRISEQETTDFEKSLKFCVENKLNEIMVLGGSSMRPDHTLNNYSVMKRYYKKLNIRMLTDEYEIFFIRKRINFRYRINSPVSLLALPKAERISTRGLKYGLTNSDLEFGIKEGALNESVSSRISISFGSGSLLLFRKHFIVPN